MSKEIYTRWDTSNINHQLPSRSLGRWSILSWLAHRFDSCPSSKQKLNANDEHDQGHALPETITTSYWTQK